MKNIISPARRTASSRTRATRSLGMTGALLLACNLAAQAVEPPKPFGPTPSARQLKWHEIETMGMISFSTATYADKEWGYGDEPASSFNPTKFDAKQIAGALKAANLNSMVIVTKHHGGFCLWPSKYTDYSVKNSPWRDGKGDMVKELVDAARAEGMQVAMYLSPWDRNHAEYGKPGYLKYFHDQMTELLTGYGPIIEVWLDGANGGDGYYGGTKENRQINRLNYYDWSAFFNLVHKLQPDANIFSDVGPDLRWVGNEGGYAGDPCWATFTPKYRADRQPLEIDPKTGYFKVTPIGESIYQEATSGQRDGKYWMPAEADFPMRGGWFWHPNDSRRSPAALINNYFLTVGRNCAFDLGVAPDRDGLLDEGDVAALKGFGDRLNAIFKTNLAMDAKATASNVRGNSKTYAAANAIKGQSKFKNYWATDDGVKDAEIILDFGKPVEFSVISLREPIQLGERIDGWALDSWQNGQWQEFAKGTCIGARRLWRGQAMGSDKVRLRLINASASPAISEFGVYLEPAESRAESGIQELPKYETGLSHIGWNVVSATAEAANGGEAVRAIDGNPTTLWNTVPETGKLAPPQSLVVDMGKSHELTGFLYLPRQDGTNVGNITKYSFSVSDDGKTWKQVEAGEFANIASNPIQQKIQFKKPVNARYFKFTAADAVEGCVVAAEIGVTGK